MSELGSEEKTRLMIGIFAKVEICYFGSKSLVVGKMAQSLWCWQGDGWWLAGSKSLVVGKEMVGGWQVEVSSLMQGGALVPINSQASFASR
jgi:hypothetical protein